MSAQRTTSAPVLRWLTRTAAPKPTRGASWTGRRPTATSSNSQRSWSAGWLLADAGPRGLQAPRDRRGEPVVRDPPRGRSGGDRPSRGQPRRRGGVPRLPGATPPQFRGAWTGWQPNVFDDGRTTW